MKKNTFMFSLFMLLNKLINQYQWEIALSISIAVQHIFIYLQFHIYIRLFKVHKIHIDVSEAHAVMIMQDVVLYVLSIFTSFCFV